MSSTVTRYRTLDSVRGIAAFVVLLHHCLMTLVGGGEDRMAILRQGVHAHLGWLYATPLRLAVSGPVAVLLFFVLSGFVLTLSVRSSARPTAAAFAVSRFARIWIPFAFVILCSAALSLLLAPQPVVGASPWFHAQWGQGGTPSNVIRHLLMTGTGIDLDSPMWSLIYELRVSLVFPLLVLITVRLGNLTLIWAAALSIICAYAGSHAMMAGGVSSLVSTGTYVYFFVIGILIAIHRDKLAAMAAEAPRSAIPLLWLAALAGLAIAPGDTSHVATLDMEALLLFNGMAAGLLIILCTVNGFASKLLLHRVPLFLGRISYSLYLTHVIVIAAIVHAVGGHVPIHFAVLASIPAAVIIADLCQRLVERPSQLLGKRVAAGLGRHEEAAIAT